MNHIKAMKQALEALEKNFESLVSGVTHAMTVNAINAIREALADIGNPITEQLSIPTVITCPFCASKHVPGWLHDLNMDRGAYEEQPAIKQDLTPEQNQCNFPLCQSEDYQLEALLLADDLVEIGGESNLTRMLAAGELRRLHKVNQELLEALKNIKHHFDTDEYAWEIANLALAKVGEQL